MRGLVCFKLLVLLDCFYNATDSLEAERLQGNQNINQNPFNDVPAEHTLRERRTNDSFASKKRQSLWPSGAVCLFKLTTMCVNINTP